MEMNKNIKANIALISLTIGLILSLLVAVALGSTKIEIQDVYSVILDGVMQNIGIKTTEPSNIFNVVWHIRLPRIILAMSVGAILSVSGVVLQACVKNPLADPYVLGISSGAYLGATLSFIVGSVTIFGMSSMGIFGFIGAFAVSIIVLFIANIGGRSNTVKLILAGSAVSAVCSAFANFIILTIDSSSTAEIVKWSMGGLGGADHLSNIVIFIVGFIGVIFFITQSRTLNLMLLGDETATTLGTNVHSSRIIYLVITSLLIGFSVYKAGMIGFVGLLIPHIVRMLWGTNHKYLIPLSALSGSIFLVWADVLCRNIIPNNEVPIGIITSMIGAPVFIYLLVKKRYGFGGNQ